MQGAMMYTLYSGASPFECMWPTPFLLRSEKPSHNQSDRPGILQCMTEIDSNLMVDALFQVLMAKGYSDQDISGNDALLARLSSQQDDDTKCLLMPPLSKDMWMIADAGHRLALLQHALVGLLL